MAVCFRMVRHGAGVAVAGKTVCVCVCAVRVCVISVGVGTFNSNDTHKRTLLQERAQHRAVANQSLGDAVAGRTSLACPSRSHKSEHSDGSEDTLQTRQNSMH